MLNKFSEIFGRPANPKIKALIPWIGAIVYASVVFKGTPALFHDWPSPYQSFALSLRTTLGWDSSGIGAPVSYPSSFLLVPLIGLLSSLLGTHIATIIFVGGIGYFCAYGLQNCSMAISTSWAPQISAVLFGLFNPWAYTELVAGHTFMLLSYGGVALLLALFIRAERRQLPYIISALLIVPQIQFFVIVFPFASVFCWLTRKRAAFWAWMCLALPIIVGVLINKNALMAIPLTIAWEKQQSISAVNAVRLTGYFAKYAQAYNSWPSTAGWLVFFLAVVGAVRVALSERKYLYVVAITIVSLLIAVGTRAPWGWIVQMAFLRFPEAGLLRELYDVLGITAIGYALLVSIAARRSALVCLAWLGSSLALALLWLSVPPQSHWVLAEQLPKIKVVGKNERFALLPAFQPMSFRGRGSGIDPDAYPRGNNVTPLNESFPSYPAETALASYLETGNDSLLRGLGVGDIIVRPWMSTNMTTLAPQFAISPAKDRPHYLSTHTVSAVPELTTRPFPHIGSLDTNIGAGDVFFADARAAHGSVIPKFWQRLGFVTNIATPKRKVNARLGWVDARLAFIALPALGQPFGGALTVSRTAVLRFPHRSQALVYVKGALTTLKGRIITTTTRGYRWVHLPVATNAVRCRGLCVVALLGNPPHLKRLPPPTPFTALRFTSRVGWFASAVLPPGGPRMLLYSVAYNRLWKVIGGGIEFDHVRIDGVLNGWLFRGNSHPLRIVIVELGAACVALSELIALLGLAVIAYIWISQRRRAGRI